MPPLSQALQLFSELSCMEVAKCCEVLAVKLISYASLHVWLTGEMKLYYFWLSVYMETINMILCLNVYLPDLLF